MKLSVIIVNFNQKYFPKLCLEALQKSVAAFPFEIIFVDNASSDESIDFLREVAGKKDDVLIEKRKKVSMSDTANESDVILIENEENIGYGQANNLGAKLARGEYLLFLNPDVSVNEDTLQKLVTYAENNKDVAILGPKILYHNGQIQESCRRFMTFTDLIIKRTPLKVFRPFRERHDHYLMCDFDHNRIQEVDLLVGACFLFPRPIFEKLGGFDPRYFLFMEDFDLCQKAHGAGLKVVYYPETSVTHYHKRLSDGGLFNLPFKKVFWHHLISSLKYFWRWRKTSPQNGTH